MTTPSTLLAAEGVISDLMTSERVRRAFRFFEEASKSFAEEHAALVGVPAPPFGEAARAEYLREMFEACGLEGAALDEEGNCVALRRGGTALCGASLRG
jgi:hypothetical protein